MQWVTRAHLHLDRVATPWLIRRFVDPDAEFIFLEWDEQPPENAGLIPFGMPGIELSSHDERGTTFAKVMRRYALRDIALVRMERIVAAGVRHALGHEPPADETSDDRMLGAALDLLGSGLGVAFEDADHLRHGIGLYEGLYALCQVQELPVSVTAGMPGTLPARIEYLRAALGRTSV
jgi:hypothetical protein